MDDFQSPPPQFSNEKLQSSSNKHRGLLVLIILVIFFLAALFTAVFFWNKYYKKSAQIPVEMQESVNLGFDIVNTEGPLATQQNIQEYAKDKIIVSFKIGTTQLQINKFLKDNNFIMKETDKNLNVSVLSVPNNKDPNQLSDQLKTSSIIDFIEPNYYAYANDMLVYPNDPGYQKGVQWNLKAINMDKAWQEIKDSPLENNVVVAILDSGVAYRDFDPGKEKNSSGGIGLNNWKTSTVFNSKEGTVTIWTLGAKERETSLGGSNSPYDYVKDYLQHPIDLTSRDIVLSVNDADKKENIIILGFQYVSFLKDGVKVFVEVSADGEKTWKEINHFNSPSLKQNPGDINGWNSESLDITAYAGKNIVLRFRANSANFDKSYLFQRPIFALKKIVVTANLTSEGGKSTGTYSTVIFQDKSTIENTDWERMTYKKPQELNNVVFLDNLAWNFVDDTRYAEDDDGHGTHITGTMVQTTNNKFGVAGIAGDVANNKIQILPVKVLDAYGRSDCLTVAKGIDYAVEKGVDIINLSMEANGQAGCRVIKRALDDASEKGITVVASCGNQNKSGCFFPAGYKGVIGVGAVGSDKKRAIYSNYGNGLSVVAPGNGIVQQTFLNVPKNIVFLNAEGTSMAAPHVSAVAALLLAQDNTLKPNEVKSIIECTAQELGDKDQYGAGLLDAGKALDKKSQKSCIKFACAACPNSATVNQVISFYPYAYSPNDKIGDKNITAADFDCNNLASIKAVNYQITSNDYPLSWIGIQGCSNQDVCEQSFSAPGKKEATLKVGDKTATCAVEISDWKVSCGAASPAYPKINDKVVFTAVIDFGSKIGSGDIDALKANNPFGINIKDLKYSWSGDCNRNLLGEGDCIKTFSQGGKYTVNLTATWGGITKTASCEANIASEKKTAYQACEGDAIYNFSADGKRGVLVKDCSQVVVRQCVCGVQDHPNEGPFCVDCTNTTNTGGNCCPTVPGTCDNYNWENNDIIKGCDGCKDSVDPALCNSPAERCHPFCTPKVKVDCVNYCRKL